MKWKWMKLTRDEENLKRLIHKFGFQDVEAHLMKYARSCIRVETTSVENEDDLKIGQSKVGGRPDLPKDMEWVTVPKNIGTRSSVPFIAQFNVEEVSAYDMKDLLPQTGMLYLFADYELARVVFYDGDKSSLERKEFPEDLPPTQPLESGDARFEPCSLTFVHEVNLDFHTPDFDYPKGKGWRDFFDLVYASSYSRPNPPFIRDVNRLLGVPYDVPHDMQLECQLLEDIGHYYTSSSTERKAAELKKSQWQLLFQMSSDSNANMAWSDNGTICFFIKKHDLELQNFDNICLAFFTP